MAYIKSYSNYVIQQKHQVLNNGTVFERDFSTVGGIGDTFNSNQKVYRQGTFVYSINGEIITPKLYSKEGWKKNGENDVWTKNDIANNINEQNSLSIVLKQDYYKLKDFAYFGSCTELIRASINDIIQSFPGELFVPKINDSGMLVITTDNEPLNNEDEYQFLIDNPFHLDIHTSFNAFNFEESEDLKNIQPNIDKYELFDGTNTYNISQIEITHIEDGGCGPRYFQTVKVLLEGGNIEEGNNEFIIKCYYDENEEIIYLTNAKNLEKHI